MKYNAFISYRKTYSVNADWIRQSIAGNSEYSLEDIFLDKHSIGPVLFDEKIKKAISESNCIILLVTDGCFKAKPKVEEDWYIKEIKAALSYGKRIIPVLFDGINSLSEPLIFDELNKVFTNEEIGILVKSQSIKYSDDYPDASITKLIQFVEEANATRSVFDRVLLFVRGLGILLALLFLFIALCFSIGFAWGYFSLSPKSDSVLADNTIIDGDKLHNNVENLEWCTQEYNINYGTRTQRQVETMKNKEINHLCKKVYCLELDRVFPSIQSIADEFGYCRENITCCLRNINNQQTAYGMHWYYVND